MSGPYRKCKACNGVGEMCLRCPLEGYADDPPDDDIEVDEEGNEEGNERPEDTIARLCAGAMKKVLASWVPLGYGADMTRQVSLTESTNQAHEGPTGPGGRNAPRLAPVGPSGVEGEER